MHNSSEQYRSDVEYGADRSRTSYSENSGYEEERYSSGRYEPEYPSIERPRRRLTERELDLELERRINSGLPRSAASRPRHSESYSAASGYRSDRYSEGRPRPRSEYASGDHQRRAYPADRPASASGQRRPSTGGRTPAQSGRTAPAHSRQPQHNARPQQKRPVRRQAPATFSEKLAYGLKHDNRFKVGAVLILLIIIVIILICILSGARSAADPVVQPQPTAAPTPVATPSPTAVPVQSTPQAPVQNNAVQSVQQPAAAAAPVQPSVTMVAEYELLMDKLTTDKELGLPECQRVDHSYFNDTLFVGDSVSKKLQMYVTNERKDNPNLLGNANFLTAQSFSARNALKNVSTESIHPVYQGVKMPLEDVIAKSGVKRVYIMLGLNDVGISGVDDAVKNMLNLLRLIKEKSPDVQIFVQSATPRLSGVHPTTEQLYAFNIKLYEYILQLKEHQIYFVDVAYIMRDETGKLYEEYCSDPESMALHFNNTACEKWIDYLYTHALV